MATEEGRLMTKVMPNKTVGVNLQSSLSVESSSFSTIQDFARNCYASSNNISGIDVDAIPFTPIQKTGLKEKTTDVAKLNKDVELTERIQKRSSSDSHLPSFLPEGESDNRNDDTDDESMLLKKQTCNAVLPDNTDFFARSAFSLISNAKGTEPSLGLTELSSMTCSPLIGNVNSIKSKTEINVKKQNLKLNVPLTSAKCLPNSNISLLHPKGDREINLSMPSSVYGTKLSNIECVLTGLNLDKKIMDSEQVCESELPIEQQMVHLTGGSVNLISGIHDDAQNTDCSEEEKCNEKSIKESEGKIDVISKVTDNNNYFSSQKQILESLQENHKNSIISYPSVLNTTGIPDNLKLFNIQKTTKTQSLEQRISKLIAQNAAIVETLNPIRPRHYVRHLSFSEPLNEREHRKSSITSKLRRFSEDLSSTVNNTPYLVNKSKLQIALMGQSDSGIIVNCKSLDSVPEHKDIAAAYPYNLNGMCYTISESEKSPFSPPASSKSNVPEEKDFVKPATSKAHYNLISNEKFVQLDDKFPGEFAGKVDKLHRKPESSIIKDLLLKPKHARMSHSAIPPTESKLSPQLNIEALGKQKVNDAHSSIHICKFCNISFLSKDNLEAHQLHYCKLRNQSTTKSGAPTGFPSKEQPLLEKLNDSSLIVSYDTSAISDDRLNAAGIVSIRSFGNDVETWIPPLKQRKLSEPVLSKSHIENCVSRRRTTTEFLRNDKSTHCIPSASGGWNSQMCGGKVQIFDEIGNKHMTLKSGIHNQTSLFTLLGVENRHSFALAENSSWGSEGGKLKKSTKTSSLPTVVVTISKPELNSGGTVMQVHSSMAAGGSSLSVQASSQTPLMATGSSEMTKWKSFQPDISFGTKLDLSPISKNVANEGERLVNLAEQSPAHCNTPKSLVIESPCTSPLSDTTDYESSSSIQSSALSFGKQERSPVRKIGRSENREFEFSSPLGKSLCVMSICTTMENATKKNSSDSSSKPLFCIPDGPSAVFNYISAFGDSSTIPSTADSVSPSDDKIQTTSSCKTSTEQPSDNANKKCPNPSRPTFLPLKKGITLVGSTLISPETPRPKKSSIQLYLGGHAYTSLGLKCSTRSTFCCIYRPQPMYVPQDTDPKLSMYSNWQVVPSKEELLGLTPSQLLGLYNSRQKKESCKATLTIAKMGNTLVCTHSSYWTFRMQDAAKEDLQKHSKLTEKGSDQDITIEDKSQLESLTIPIEIYVSAIESGILASKEQAKMDENSSPSLKENSHSEDTAEESCTSHSNAHSPDDTMLSNPPKRARHSEGNCCTTTDEGTYVRGRGWGKYICEECGIRCKKPSVLKKHIRTHTNLRPYKCYHCAFAFKTKGNLTKHMKSKAHFKKCIELGVVPVPTTVDDSQIDEEALDKQEKLDKDICPSLNAQEFEDGEEIDDDADESDHSDNEEDDDCNSDTLNLGERIREMKNLKEVDHTHSANEKEFSATRDMTEKEGEAAQSLLHLSTCNVSQSSQKKGSVKSLSSGMLSMDHSEDSQSSSVLGSEITIIQNSSCITDFEDALSSPIASKGMATSPIISSNPHRSSAKLTIGTGFLIADSTPSPGQTFSENRSMERKSGSFENISPLSFRVTSPNSDYRERPHTMWTTTSPQSWHGHSSLSLFPNAHVKYQGKGVIWDGQLLDTGIPKPIQFAIDSDQPMDLRVSKTKDRIPEEASRLTLYEDRRISQNVETDHIVRTENPKSNSSAQPNEEVHCSKPEVHNIQELQIPCLATDNLSPKPVEESSMRPAETTTTAKCQDSKSYAKPTSCHENSIPLYNVGGSEPTFDGSVSTQAPVQYELPSKPVVDDGTDSESQPTCPISPISPPVDETVNHMPVIFHESTATSSHSISKSDNGTPPRQRECLGKNGALRNSYVSEGKCTCAICNKTFTKPSQLRLHVNIHYFERPFRCDDCAISFRTNGHLEKHKRSASHYNKLHTNTSFGTPCADNPRPFKCSDCNIAFRMHGHLAKHLRSKMHIMKLECLGKLPFGMYAEMERTGVNFNDIDTTDCDNSLESLQEIAQHLYTPPNAQQSMDLSTPSTPPTKPKPHFMNSSYSSATPLQIINTSSSCYNSEMQQINPALNLSSFNNCSNDRTRKLSQDKGLLAVNDHAGGECRTTTQKEYITEFSHLDASTQPALHSRTCPCDSCISSKITSFSSLGDSCTSRPVKKEQWKLKDRLIAEFQEESTHMENPR